MGQSDLASDKERDELVLEFVKGARQRTPSSTRQSELRLLAGVLGMCAPDESAIMQVTTTHPLTTRQHYNCMMIMRVMKEQVEEQDAYCQVHFMKRDTSGHCMRCLFKEKEGHAEDAKQ